MSKLHGQEGETRMGRGELRNPGDRADQPGQRMALTPTHDDNERDTRRDSERKPEAEPRRGDKAAG